jgi:aminoglycoside phosphotransferase (APT) family kinase protein
MVGKDFNSGCELTRMKSTSEKHWRSLLGTDLWGLFQKFGSSVAKVEMLTTLASPCLRRGAYKVTYEDGSVFKGRCFERAVEADRVSTLSRFLDPNHFPAVLEVNGKGAVIEWVDGHPLNHGNFNREHIEMAAGIQAALAVTPLPSAFSSTPHCQSGFWKRLFESRVHFLFNTGIITTPQAAKLLETTREWTPPSIAVGLTHGDLCVENILIDGNGNLFVIDLETLSVTAIAYDLARTLYRWPMTPDERAVYLAAYERTVKIDDLLDNLPFWILLVLCNSVVFRFRGQIQNVGEAIGELEGALNCRSEKDLLRRYGW